MEPIDLHIVIDSCKPPKSIISYTPPHEVLFFGSGKKQQRNIFKHQHFDSREIEKLRRLKEMIQKQKLSIPKEWDDSDLLKFVYGANFKTRGAFKALKSCLDSRAEVLTHDFHLLYGKIYEILVKHKQKAGPLYMHGRDCHYRPLLVMNFTKFDLKKVISKQFSIDLYLQAACFVLEFASHYMLFPGKVENWMCISDIGFMGLTDLPLNTLRKITKILQDVFKCRVALSQMVNVNKSIYFIYSCLKPFLDPVTIEKISIEKGSVPVKLLTFFNPHQVEERYGGKARNLEVFWPPFFPDAPVQVDGVEEIVSEHSMEEKVFIENELGENEESKEVVVNFESQSVVFESAERESEEEKEEKLERREKKSKRRRKKKERRIERRMSRTLEDFKTEVDDYGVQETERKIDKVLKKPSVEIDKQEEKNQEKSEILVEDADNIPFCQWDAMTCQLQ